MGQAWSTGVTVGLALAGLQIGGNGGRSDSNTVEYDQTITMPVPPGQMGVLVALVQYNRTSGTMQIDNEDSFTAYSNQPVKILSYSPDLVHCGSQFNGNTSGLYNCSSSNSPVGPNPNHLPGPNPDPVPDASMPWEGHSRLPTSLTLLVVLMVSIYLLA